MVKAAPLHALEDVCYSEADSKHLRIIKSEAQSGDRALKMAIAQRSPPRGCIFHSDRGSQYCSHDYQKVLREHGLNTSMSGKGTCYDCEYGIAA